LGIEFEEAVTERQVFKGEGLAASSINIYAGRLDYYTSANYGSAYDEDLGMAGHASGA
jgi:hypothetical protein